MGREFLSIAKERLWRQCTYTSPDPLEGLGRILNECARSLQYLADQEWPTCPKSTSRNWLIVNNFDQNISVPDALLYRICTYFNPCTSIWADGL